MYAAWLGALLVGLVLGLLFSLIGIVGSFVGGRIGSYVPQARLKRGFAVFLVLMGVVILGQNVAAMIG